MSEYRYPSDHLEYAKEGISRYLSGQIHIAFQFPGEKAIIDQFQDSESKIRTASALDDVLSEYRSFMTRLNAYIDELTLGNDLLPHQSVVYKLGVPHFPPIFLSYDKPKSEYPQLSEVSNSVFGGSLDTDGTSVLNEKESQASKMEFFTVTGKN